MKGLPGIFAITICIGLPNSISAQKAGDIFAYRPVAQPLIHQVAALPESVFWNYFSRTPEQKAQNKALYYSSYMGQYVNNLVRPAESLSYVWPTTCESAYSPTQELGASKLPTPKRFEETMQFSAGHIKGMDNREDLHPQRNLSRETHQSLNNVYQSRYPSLVSRNPRHLLGILQQSLGW